MIRPILFDLRNLVKIHLKGPVRDEFDVIESNYTPILAM